MLGSTCYVHMLVRYVVQLQLKKTVVSGYDRRLFDKWVIYWDKGLSIKI